MKFHQQLVTMLTKSLIAFAGLIVVSVTYKLDISDSEFRSALGDSGRTADIFKCLLGKDNDSCDLIGKAFKGILQEVINTDCAKCSDEQNKAIGEFFARVKANDPEKINKTLDIYDPQRENFNKYASSWKKRVLNA